MGHLFLAYIYVFANEFGLPLLRNNVLDVAFNGLVADAPLLPFDVMAHVEQHLRDSALRNILLDVILACDDRDKVA
jgi:hypothetical protein